MPVVLLTVGKLALLLLLYLFLWRVVRVIAADIRDPAVAQPSTPRPAVAQPERRPSGRAIPTSLVVHPVEGAPHTVALDGERLLFGRAPHVDQHIEDDYVSDEHAELVNDGTQWRIRDLGSTNGTYLNGQKVIAPTTVAAGDQLQLGKTRLEVRR
jgi:hypothetical protein